MATEQVLVFKLSTRDLELVEEISLAGVIAGKIAKGEYWENDDYAKIQAAYESCHKVNTALHSKLNRVRRAMDYDELQTDEPEDELD